MYLFARFSCRASSALVKRCPKRSYSVVRLLPESFLSVFASLQILFRMSVSWFSFIGARSGLKIVEKLFVYPMFMGSPFGFLGISDFGRTTSSTPFL